MSDSALVRSEVVETGFGFFTDKDLKSLSCCKITSTLSQDALGRYLHSGLYDSRMGPADPSSTCSTCSEYFIACPGHCGHIELDVPVYRPLLFPALFQILKSKCAFCHKLKMSTLRSRHILIKLKLLEMGDLASLNRLDDLLLPTQIFTDEEVGKQADKISIELEKQYAMYEERYQVFSKARSKTGAKQYKANGNLKSLQRVVVESFQRNAASISKCENCQAAAVSYRKDGYSKIFQRPLSRRARFSTSSSGKTLKTALESLHDDGQTGMDAEAEESNNDDDENDEEGRNGKATKLASADKYLVPMEVEAQLKLLWSTDGDLLDFIWSRAVDFGRPSRVADKERYSLFFQRIVLVPPNRFRPMSKDGAREALHPHSIHLTKILEANDKLRRIARESVKTNTDEEAEEEVMQVDTNQPIEENVVDALEKNNQLGMTRLVSAWIELQNAVNCFIDSSKDPNPLANTFVSGLRQLLERKEGLFRMHMMGKRVNYCARSVISPDPYIGTNEIGLPVAFARTLHYPTPVNDLNIKLMRKLVEAGPLEYPGCNQVEKMDGQILKLERMNRADRVALAKLLKPGMKVFRHLVDGDILLVNRQPTLHKPGIMAHRARVFRWVKEKTLRLSYANCNSYNADFDGDEMNCHFLQNDIARAEAYSIANTDNQYIVPTSGNPLRGLIQDHVASGVKLTCRNIFLTQGEFMQLLFIAVTGLPGTEVITPSERIVLPTPAVLKPRKLWTGKQVISALLRHLCRPPLPALNLDGKTRTPATAFGVDQDEHIIVFRNGELLCGVIDKASIGNSALGIVHAVYELYGPDFAGRILNAFGRLFTYYLQDAGQSCGIEALTLTRAAEGERSRLLTKVIDDNFRAFTAFSNGESVMDSLSGPLPSNKEILKSERKVDELFAADKKTTKIKLDGAMQSVVNKSASDVIKACLPGGLERPFQKNDFSTMVLTGAKGSAVNQSQISCFLGQQALEGLRVPIMISGKTLPSFRPYDSNPRANGFIQDRFLTGVKPQEYYFHCMAGREGLVDTAVKTSRSGYLQRCLVKHLEELKVNYDMTVRDSESNIVQFLYGEDGLDPVSSNLLGGKSNQILFMARNNQALVHKYSLNEQFFSHGMDYDTAMNSHRKLDKARQVLASETSSSSSSFSKGSVILARRKINSAIAWSRSNIQKTWVVAEVIKSRSIKHEESEVTYDIQYDDGTVEKRVPISIEHESNRNSESSLKIPLLRAGLPDTPMSSLRLDTNIGAVSEKAQSTLQQYIRSNPDKAISSATTDSTVTADGLELLMWVKYMRSLACPGEAVGCIAAQSIGEPSTQMTLNTFHLAGHGGANVTLGIPRLREILMTASRVPKTPTMLLPLLASSGVTTAKSIARGLSRVTLSDLLHHSGGIQVTERFSRDGGIWNRQYEIKLSFEPHDLIHKAFGLSFNRIVKVVELALMKKLNALLHAEQKKSGDKKDGRQDNMRNPFASKVKDTASSERTHANDDADEEGGSSGRKGKKTSDDLAQIEEGDEEEEDENDDDAEQGTLKFSGQAEGAEYEGDEGNVVDEGDIGQDYTEQDSANVGAKSKSKASVAAAGSSKKNFSSAIKSLDDLLDATDDDDDEGDADGDDDTDVDSEDDYSPTPTAATPSSSSLMTKKRELAATMTSSSSSSTGRVSLSTDSGALFSERESWVKTQVSFPASARRFLMVQLVERACESTTVQATPGIINAYAVTCDIDGKEYQAVQTEGVNFEEIWSRCESAAQLNEIKSNDIWQLLCVYGVEAARISIVNEINAVFGSYGIDVNPRHLSLIADYMTRTGSFNAMNRAGMLMCPSPFLQMSFESTTSFLTRASMDGQSDYQQSPSARIVLGGVPKVGSGCFELLVPLKTTSADTVLDMEA